MNRARIANALAVWLGLAVPAAAQPQVAPPPAAPVDTVTAAVELLSGNPTLGALEVRPDSVAFGGVVWIVAEAPAGAALADSLVLPDWLATEPLAGSAPGDLAGRLVFPVRVYRIDPFRLASGGRTSGVVTVSSRGTDGSQTAPVRAPRPLGWNALVVAAVLLLLLAVLLLGRRLWHRRRKPRPRPGDRPVPGAAWPALALDLEGLLADLQRTGDGRAFLDGLAATTRTYAALRFGIAGREMTGREIGAACLRLGYAAEIGRAFARLVDELDARRFDPEPVGEGWCRERACALLTAVAPVRIAAGPPGLAAGELAVAAAAWERLQAELGQGGGRAA